MRRGFIGLVCLVFLVPGCGPREHALSGTGSTFVAPLLDRWSGDYQNARGVKVVYESVGSGIGFDRWKGGLFDFCCSDAPLTDKQLSEAKANRGEVVHVPLTIGAVVPVYNLELPAGKTVVFNGPVLSGIFLGDIKKWNDKPLADLNPGVPLPDEKIVVVHRLDGSGTTYIWTDYLSKVDEKKWTAGTSITWPAGEGAVGNSGVSALIQQKPFSIGYVSLQEANSKKLKIGKMTKTVTGPPAKTVDASAASVQAAVDSLTVIPDDLRFSITNAPGDDTWPISGATWAIVSVDQPGAQGQTLKDFLKWAVHDGQKAAGELDYVPLPDKLTEKADKQIDRIKVGK